MVFRQYEEESGVNPAKIINYFESKEEQTEVASLFNERIREDMSIGEKEKALSEIVNRIKKHSLEEQSVHAINDNDTAKLQQIIIEQANLQKLHIYYKDG